MQDTKHICQQMEGLPHKHASSANPMSLLCSENVVVLQ
jgi:hypothetical protein